jgi:hypothetical protein
VRLARLLPATLAGFLVVVPAGRAQTPPQRAPRDTAGGAAADSTLTVNLLGRLEFKGEQTKNDRCFANQLFSATLRCRVPLTPDLNFQFSLLSAGSVADRVHVNVDYDSQREFDGSNNISITYQGKGTEFLRSLEIGNVTFAPPPSRFITSGIPSGNYGVQAVGQVGKMRLTAIVAQQKGNVVKEQVYTVGARTTQQLTSELEDYQIEPRRFFFTVDPTAFGSRYPNIDILDPQQMSELASSLPDTLRPSRVFLYRLLIGGQPPNPNGPRFVLIDDPASRAGQVYELLRQGVDYYLDPSQLWFALVRPLSLATERLVVAYTLHIGGRDTTIAQLGGTPDLEFTTSHTQYAHLVWDPQVSPGDPAFRREIRSVYRVGGADVRRETVTMRIVAGSGADQEKPPGLANSYLELFGLAQRTNPAAFDARDRLWPRPNDPNDLIGPLAAVGALIPDVFVVFPSLEPFSRRGLARPPSVAANDTLYTTPSEYLYSPQHPQSFYRLAIAYESQGGAGAGTIALASVQLRPGSERLALDGRPLLRGIDYDIDYDLGRVRLLTVDTLSTRPQRVTVRYEENPLFTSVPTSIFGLSSEWTLPFGRVAFTAIRQSQRTTFTRPPLGYEPQASMMAGLSASLGWSLGAVSRALARVLPGADSAATSRLDLRAEVALSQPHQSGSQQAYLESFEGDGGTSVNLLDAGWQYGSQPSLGARLTARLGAQTFDTTRATTLAFQNNGTDVNGRAVTFSIQQIDPSTILPGGAFAGFEQILWLSLYPLGVGGLLDPSTGIYRWRVANPPSGRHWRSLRTPLGPGGSGVDLTRAEQLVFWTLVDTSAARRGRNPVLVFDFGDVSENTVAFAPETLRVTGTDSLYAGRRMQGFDVLNSERDPFSRAFSADANDTGLPGDVVDRLLVHENGSATVRTNFGTCALGTGRLVRLGDARADCTIHNSRLDEEDLDQDNVLNFTSTQREQERLRRFIVDLSVPAAYNRVGTCGVAVNDANQSHPAGAPLCWVQVRVPFNAPDDSIAGGPPLRRVRALRVTVVSGATAPDNQFTLVPIARLNILGATWAKRAPRPLRGISGDEQTLGGFVSASVIGTQDRDSTRGILYEPPPGVTDEPEQQQPLFGLTNAAINERSLRLQAGGIPEFGRAEAFLRFPEGQRNMMTYRELRLWARGRGKGWGPDGDLQFFVKLGRDANNFYLFRTPINSGPARTAWEPEIHVRFAQFYALRARLERALLGVGQSASGCTSVDSALIATSGPPPGATGDQQRRAACQDGYIVYSVDPAVTPPNLNAVQDMAVGIVRVDSLRGVDPPLSGDTLEVWVDEMRLADADERSGHAELLGLTFHAGDAGSIQINALRHDPNFRQLGEAQSFYSGNDLDVAATWRLDKLVRGGLGLVVPVTVTHSASSADPAFLSRSDIRGDAIDRLRKPRGATTTVAVSVRRAAPLAEGWLAPVVNNLGLTAAWNGSGNRSEYTRARAHRLDLGVDYFFLGEPSRSRDGAGGQIPRADATSPPATDSGSNASALLRAFVPSTVRVLSSFARTDDRLDAFLKPATAADDPASQARAQQRLLRNSASVELRPIPGLSARWDASTLHDLRDYGTTTPLALAAAGQRSTVAGVDVGLERERNLVASLLYAPISSGWLRPRGELASSFAMLRDPNAPVLLDSASATPRLGNRFGNTQRALVGAGVDVSRAFGAGARTGSLVRQVATAIGTIDLSVSRDQLSSYDAAPLDPSFGYQLGLGSIDAFRSIRDVLAASAATGTQVSASNTITLPFGASIGQRAQRTDTRHWARRLSERQSSIDGEQLVFPDVSLRWSGRPLLLDRLFSTVGATVRAVHTRQAFIAPSDIQGLPAEVRSIRIRTYPIAATATTAPGNVSLTASFTRTNRSDSLPGSVGQSFGSEMSGDVSKSFPLPATWKVDRGLRTRFSYQRSETQSYVSNLAAIGARSRLTDNGRHALTVNAGTDLAENLAFSLQGSRVVSFDKNFNRRLTQTVISAVLNIQFFGGTLR